MTKNSYRTDLTVGKVASIVGAKLPDSIDGTQKCNRVMTQSVYAKPGDIIISAGWYGHATTITDSLKNGATLVFCDEEVKKQYENEERVVAIANPLEAVTVFQREMAKGMRAKRIAITGSVGKTTTTELINSVIANTYNTLTHHSMANSHGAILRNVQQLKPQHKYWVQEVGGVQPGYIESTARFLCPDIVVLTNISDSHLDLYKTKENIFKDKGSLERYAQRDGVVVVNYDDDILRNAEYSHKVITYSKTDSNADYYGEDIRTELDGLHFTAVTPNGRCQLHLNLYGEHNVYNALAAVAVGQIAGVSLKKIPDLMESYHTSGMRQNVIEVGGYKIFVDIFNAEPQTVLGAAQTLNDLKVDEGVRKIFATGHIDKLGESSSRMHAELGHKLAKLNLDFVALYNGDAKETYDAMLKDGCRNVFYTDDRDVFDQWLHDNVRREDILFCKSGQFKCALAKSLNHVYGTTFQNMQQFNDGKDAYWNGYKLKLRQDNIAEVVGYDGNRTELIIPKKYGDFSIIRIAPFAFAKNKSITSISIPDSVTTIGQEAFFGCSSLIRVKLPQNLKYVGKHAFNSCTGLKNVFLPDGTIHLDQKAFYDCVNLEKIFMPSSIGFLGDSAFGNCKKLSVITNADTKAYKYAADNNISVVLLEKYLNDISEFFYSGKEKESEKMILKKKDSLTAEERVLVSRANYWKQSYYKRTNNNNILSSNQKNQVQQFWKKYQDLFVIDSIFHSFYFDKTGNFDVKFMPVDIYYSFVDPYFNKWDVAKVIDNKCLYRQLFGNLPQPKTPLCRMNNIWTNELGELVSREEIRNIVENCGELVVKQANDSEGGHNIFFISGNDKISEFSKACETIKKDLVVQEAIKQHEVLKSVNPTSVNTIRVLSMLRQDEVKIYSVILRMGVNNSRVDNISQGGISCGVDETGRLRQHARNYRGECFERHPSTGINFRDVVIPNFDEVCNLVKKAHPLIPDFRLVSWDISVNEEGNPLLVEANLCYGELNLHQLSNGPVFGEDTEMIMQEVFNK